MRSGKIVIGYTPPSHRSTERSTDLTPKSAMLSPLFKKATLYTYLLEKEMMVNGQENGLKGQHNLAQGKRSGALDWKAGRRIVRAITFIKEKILFRTREITICLREMMSCNSVRKELFALFIESSRTVFLCILYPGRRFVRSSRNYALG